MTAPKAASPPTTLLVACVDGPRVLDYQDGPASCVACAETHSSLQRHLVHMADRHGWRLQELIGRRIALWARRPSGEQCSWSHPGRGAPGSAAGAPATMSAVEVEIARQLGLPNHTVPSDRYGGRGSGRG